MARIRTIKPEFFRHEELYEAEKESGLPLRVAFAGLWTVADREGRFKWKPTQLKLDVLPYDSVDMPSVLNVLEVHGFIKRYCVGSDNYAFIPSFKEHQVINIREAQSKIPAPGDAPEPEMKTPPSLDKNITPKIRQEIFNRDGNKCLRCGGTEDLTIDHIFPQSCGGTHHKTNLRTLCRGCNSSRPVQGSALDKDLELDGLTWNDMQRICTHGNAHGEGKGREGKGREHIQVACAVCGIFEKHYLLPDERMAHTANWFMTIDQQVEILLKEWSPEEAVKQVEAYKRHCKETKRKLIATDFRVAATLLSSNWIKLNAPEPVPKQNDFAEAEYNRKLWTDEAWRQKYDKQIRTNPAFQEHFKLSRP